MGRMSYGMAAWAVSLLLVPGIWGQAIRPGGDAAAMPVQRAGSAAVRATDTTGTPATDTRATDRLTARLNFSEAPLDIVLADYSEKTGKTLLRAPGLPTPSFTLRSQGDLTIPEYLQAVETVLTMHGVGLVAYGEQFVRVVPVKSIRREALDIFESVPEGVVLDQSGSMISQMVRLQHIDIQEATAAIEPMRNANGQANGFERTNSILLTDYAANINRMLQVLRMLDQPIEAREEPNIIQIRHASASEIKQRLEEIIAESQKEQQEGARAPRQRSSGAPGVERNTPSSPPGVIRPSRVRDTSQAGQAVEPGFDPQLVADASRGIIHGRVQIIADERTNQLIIITRPENMAFFERIVAVLDVETSPDVIVEVVRLEFALAEEVAGMLNDLIGATQQDERPAGATDRDADGEGRESRRLAEIEAALRRQADQGDGKSSVGELSKDNIKILSDTRTNSLVLMASKSDVATIKDIIEDMDRMLSQVLIEAVILEVSLDDSIETGVSWVQNALTTYSVNDDGRRSPIMAFAGGGGGAIGEAPRNAANIANRELATSGLGYFFTLFDLNVNAVLRASASDSRSRVVSTPALLTTDNTEATLSSTERIYVFEGTTYVGTTGANPSARYRQEDVGLTLKVRPQINDNGVVMMEIEQEISEPGDITNTDTENLAGQRISINRSIQASIAVRSGQTIVLGGQVRERDSRNRTKIPLLGDIPLLGRLFNSDSRGVGRTETIVFITPYVLDTPEKVAQETRRRRDSLDLDGMWRQGWSGSVLAEPPDAVRPLPSTARSRQAPVDPQPQPSGKLAPQPTAQPAPKPTPKPAPAQAPRTGDAGQEDVSAFIEEQRARWRQAVQEHGAETQ